MVTEFSPRWKSCFRSDGEPFGVGKLNADDYLDELDDEDVI